ncbi:MAG: tetratricopeptide repeat protein [Chitinophagaceae bacterium]|nr:tetratricopeptide repeat protein [Chitinophagaceae bacterium]
MTILKNTFGIIITLFLLISCKQSNDQSNDQLFEKAYSLGEENQYEKAVEIYSKLIQQNGKLQVVYYNRGFCYLNMKKYSMALADFNKVMELQTHNGMIITYNKDMPYADEEVKSQVPYYDALYKRAQVKYYMDSIKSSFIDFQVLVDNNYEEKSNCLTWQGTIWVRSGKNDKACEYFQRAKSFATNNEDRQDADEYIKKYCSQEKSPH